MINSVSGVSNMVDDEAKQNIARQVREAMAHVPPLEGTTLDVDEKGIYASQFSNQFWWRVPIIASPFPRRLFGLYEVLAEIEDYLQTEEHAHIILFAGDFAEETPVPSV